mmetsp:Transcript_8932/g.20778  ORF Transcript_8932/g.20778 Transcript_8932/m.20778 type:complete len:484 (+) Transcript_8932:815-2266(+)
MCTQSKSFFNIDLVDPLLEDRLLALPGELLNGRGVHLCVLLEVDRRLPREELDAVLVRGLAAEVAVGRGAVVLGLPQLEVACERAGPAVELELDHVRDGLGGEPGLLGPVGLDEEAEGLGDADGVRELHERALGEAGVDDGLGHPPAGVGGTAVDLGGVLPGEGSSAVGSPSAVGVDDDLAAGEAGVSLRPADDELARGVEVDVARGAVVEGQGRLPVLEHDGLERLDDDLVVDELVHLGHGGGDLLLARVLGAVVGAVLLDGALGLARLGVLGGDEHGVHRGGHDGAVGLLLVGDGDLRLAVGAEPPERAVLAHVGELLAQLVGEEVREGHAAVGLVAGVAEHDALVAGADVHVVLADVHAAGDVRRLLVNAHEDLARVGAQALRVHRGQVVHEGREADLAHLVAHDLLVVQLRHGGDLPEDHDHVVLRGSLAGHLGHGVDLEARVEDGVGHLVAQLVRVALVHGLGREEKRSVHHLRVIGG